MVTVKYTEKQIWQTRSATAQGPNQPVEGILLVGDLLIAKWEEDHTCSGCDLVTVYPAIYAGMRGFVITNEWKAVEGYTESGIDDYFVPLEEGAELLLKHGAFQHLFPNEELIPALDR